MSYQWRVHIPASSHTNKHTHTHTHKLPWLYSLFLVDHEIKKTVEIDTFTVDIEDRGVRLRLTVVDTPGFGDAVNNNDW